MAAKRRTKEQSLLRREKALRLRAAGMTWDKVAQNLGYASRGAAWHDVMKSLKESHKEAAEDYRYLELERLDQMTRGVFPKALKGDTKAIDAVLKIMARRARYVPGLEVPEEHSLSSGDGTMQVIFSPGLASKETPEITSGGE